MAAAGDVRYERDIYTWLTALELSQYYFMFKAAGMEKIRVRGSLVGAWSRVVAVVPAGHAPFVLSLLPLCLAGRYVSRVACSAPACGEG